MNTEQENITQLSLVDVTKEKLLNYALSVIKARAIPDVRDGLKPVHRRIIFAMYNDLHLYYDKRFVKSAKVVGDVIGKYHPHGDGAVYDSMVRLAQDFVQRIILIDGQGNFGSIDGDSAAAYRYTEVRLKEFSNLLIEDVKNDTINFVKTYDGSSYEPTVLPSKIPHILINGSIGMAVGMATNIPTHNITEVLNAFLYYLDNENCSLKELLIYIKGPDFPTKGKIIGSQSEIFQIYETGKGTLKLRCEYEIKKNKIIINSVPWGIEKKSIVEEIGKIIQLKSIPGLESVLDLSDKEVCVEIEFDRNEIEASTIIYYLIKNTNFQTTVKFDFTCLNEYNQPNRFSLIEIFETFLNFRIQTISRLLEFELEENREKLYILLAFEKIFNDLDNVIELIKNSKNRYAVINNLIEKYDIDEFQAEKIAELKLHRLSSDEILEIQKELESRKNRVNEIQVLLRNEHDIKNIIKKELTNYIEKFGCPRLTTIDNEIDNKFDIKNLIPDCTNFFSFTIDGWWKRQDSSTEKPKLRKGDAVLCSFNHNIKHDLLLFSSNGYIRKFNAFKIEHTGGHGEPWQTKVKTKDGERLLWALSLDPEITKEFAYEKPDLPENYEEPYPHVIGITKKGRVLRYSIWNYLDDKKYQIKCRKEDEFVFIRQCKANNKIKIDLGPKIITFSCSEIPLGSWKRKVATAEIKAENVTLI